MCSRAEREIAARWRGDNVSLCDSVTVSGPGAKGRGSRNCRFYRPLLVTDLSFWVTEVNDFCRRKLN